MMIGRPEVCGQRVPTGNQMGGRIQAGSVTNKSKSRLGL